MSERRRLYFREGPESIVERDLDGLTLFYHRPSGLTHIVDSPLPEILAAMDTAPEDSTTLLKRLSARFDLETEVDALEDMERHLDTLAALGLVRVTQ